MKLCLRVMAAVMVVLGGMLILSADHRVSADPEGFDVITSPLPIKIETLPGKTITTELRMKNQGNDAENIKVGLMKFGASGSNGQPNLFNLTPNDTYAKWVTFSPSLFTAQPNVWMTVTMTIKVPPTASLGYYLAATFSRAASNGASGPQTSLKGSVATLVLLEVNTPNEKRSLELTDFTSTKSLYEYLPANFDVTVHNNGNIYLAPVGNIFILKGNKAIDTIDFNDAGGSVLPGSNRVYTVPWSDGFPVYVEKLINGKPVYDDDNKVKMNLKWDFTQFSKLRIGRYTAKLLVVYDNGSSDVPLESQVSFWVIPWKILLILLVVLAIIGFGVFTLSRSFIRKARSGVGKIRTRG